MRPGQRRLLFNNLLSPFLAFTVACAAVVLVALESRGTAPSQTPALVHFKVGERLTYGLSWGFVSAGTAAFENREAVIAVAKLLIPMILATASIVWLGFYVMTGLYMGLFARWIGRYRWIWVAVLTVGMPAAIYATFELGFRVTLPKSLLYEAGVLPF